jgi:hypothetical protein
METGAAVHEPESFSGDVAVQLAGLSAVNQRAMLAFVRRIRRFADRRCDGEIRICLELRARNLIRRCRIAEIADLEF